MHQQAQKRQLKTTKVDVCRILGEENPLHSIYPSQEPSGEGDCIIVKVYILMTCLIIEIRGGSLKCMAQDCHHHYSYHYCVFPY